jgi:hypothetical protein
VRKLIFLALLVSAFTVVPSAFADTQELLVTPYSTTVGGKADTDIDIFSPDTAAPTAKVAVYIPGSLDLTGAVGTKIGDASAVLLAKQLGGTKVQATGTITVDDPAKYAADPTAAACDANQHAAVWLLTLSASGQSIAVPLFIDQTTGADTALGSFVLQACLRSPDVPADQGGAPLGAQLIDVDLETSGVVINAPTGQNVWHAFITPFAPGSAAVDTTGTIEVRCVEPLPHSFTKVKVTYSKMTKKVTISGSLLAGGKPRAGVRVHVDAGPKPAFESFKPWGLATTGANGSFTIVKPLPKTLYAFVYVNPYFAIPCQTGPSTAPKGCAREDTSPAFGPALVLKPKL